MHPRATTLLALLLAGCATEELRTAVQIELQADDLDALRAEAEVITGCPLPQRRWCVLGSGRHRACSALPLEPETLQAVDSVQSTIAELGSMFTQLAETIAEHGALLQVKLRTRRMRDRT